MMMMHDDDADADDDAAAADDDEDADEIFSAFFVPAHRSSYLVCSNACVIFSPYACLVFALVGPSPLTPDAFLPSHSSPRPGQEIHPCN